MPSNRGSSARPPRVRLRKVSPQSGPIPLTVRAQYEPRWVETGWIDELEWLLRPAGTDAWRVDARNSPFDEDHHYRLTEPGEFEVALRAVGPGGIDETAPVRVDATRAPTPPPAPPPPPPSPPPATPVTAPMQTDFLTLPEGYTHVLPGKSPEHRRRVYQALRARGYTDVWLYAYNEGDYDRTPIDGYADPGTVTTALREAEQAGLRPILWLIPDDAPRFHGLAPEEIERRFRAAVPGWDSLVAGYVLGLEQDEYHDFGTIDRLGRALRALTVKPIYVHYTPDVWGEPGREAAWWGAAGWCTGLIFQYQRPSVGGGFLATEAHARERTAQLLARLRPLGKILIAGEYAHGVGEAEARRVGDAAMGAGAAGFGNGGTPAGAPSTPVPDQPEPPGAGWPPLDRIAWGDQDVSGWPEASRLDAQRVEMRDGRQSLPHSKAGKWPVHVLQGAEVEGNPWIIARIGGKWYAQTWEWFRPGQTAKGLRAQDLRTHVSYAPMTSWTPQPGERIGVLVTSCARHGRWGSGERTNVVWTQWGKRGG